LCPILNIGMDDFDYENISEVVKTAKLKIEDLPLEM